MPQDCWFCVWDCFGWDAPRHGRRPGRGGAAARDYRGAAAGPGAGRSARWAAGAPAASGLLPVHRACRVCRRAGQRGRYRGPVPEPVVARRPCLVRSQRDRPAVNLCRRPPRTDRRDRGRRADRGTASRAAGPGRPCRRLGDRLVRPSRRRHHGPQYGLAQHAPDRSGPGRGDRAGSAQENCASKSPGAAAAAAAFTPACARTASSSGARCTTT